MYNYQQAYSPATLQRDCKAILIPDGIPIILKKDSVVYITQVLGGMFTVDSEEGLVRIDGLDADALEQPVPEERLQVKKSIAQGKALDELVWEELRTCYDPEVPANIVDLGLIYDCKVVELPLERAQVDVKMTLTAPGCGMGGILKNDVEQKLMELPGVKVVNVELVFEPPWDRSLMSEAAKLQLGML